MKVSIVCVGRPRGAIAPAIAEYETRIGRYFRFEAIEVKEAGGRRLPADHAVEEEGERLLARVPRQTELVALHRPGSAWTSLDLADYMQEAAVRSLPGVSFVIGGAFGLSPAVISRAGRLVSVSAMTLPHELARLVLTEQLYRAGTIMRGEPYHKGAPG
jgi:23S rRNA (pseudouridine1915-N3)-methyltransferase